MFSFSETLRIISAPYRSAVQLLIFQNDKPRKAHSRNHMLPTH